MNIISVFLCKSLDSIITNVCLCVSVNVYCECPLLLFLLLLLLLLLCRWLGGWARARKLIRSYEHIYK